jgi:hypothetical protein
MVLLLLKPTSVIRRPIPERMASNIHSIEPGQALFFYFSYDKIFDNSD